MPRITAGGAGRPADYPADQLLKLIIGLTVAGEIGPKGSLTSMRPASRPA